MFTPASSQQQMREWQLKSPAGAGSGSAGVAGLTAATGELKTAHPTKMPCQTTECKISKTDTIRKGLEKTISDDARLRINSVLTSIGHLSDVEKFLLYLKLPTGAGTCPPPQDSLAGRSDLAHLSTWLKTHLEEDPTICLPKQEAFDEYNEYCEKHGYKAVGQADFGRMVRAAFPNVKPRRLGPRGQSKHCYGGMKKRTEFSSPKLPEIRIPEPQDEHEDEDVNEPDNVRVASSSLVCEWAQKLLNNEFQDVRNLAEYLVSHSYVDGRSEAAFTVIAASQKAGRALDIVMHDEPTVVNVVRPSSTSSSSNSSSHTITKSSSSSSSSSSVSAAPAAKPQHAAPPKAAAKLQLQKKLQERELIKEQKRKLEEQRCEITGEKPAVKPTPQETPMEVTGDESKKPDFDHTQGGKKVEVGKDKDKAGKQKLALTPQKLILPKTLKTTPRGGGAGNTQVVQPAQKPALANSAQPVLMFSPSPACGTAGQLAAGQLMPQQMVILSPVNRMMVPSTQTHLLQMQQPQQQQQQMQPQTHHHQQAQQQPPRTFVHHQIQPPKLQPVQIAAANNPDPGAPQISAGQTSVTSVTSQLTMAASQAAPHILPYGAVMVQHVPVSSNGRASSLPHSSNVITTIATTVPHSTTLATHSGRIQTVLGNVPMATVAQRHTAAQEVVNSRHSHLPVSHTTCVTSSSASSTGKNSLLQAVLQKHDPRREDSSPTTLAEQAISLANSDLSGLGGGGLGVVCSPSSSTSSEGGGGAVCQSRARTTSVSTHRSVGSEDSCDSQSLVSPPPPTPQSGEIYLSAATTASSKSSRGGVKCAIAKSRLAGKTVSTLLKEQRGITHIVPEKKTFENDRRPVAQLLKESREKKHPGTTTTTTTTSVNSPIVQLMSPVPPPAPSRAQTTPIPQQQQGNAVAIGNGREQPLLLHTFTLNPGVVDAKTNGESGGQLPASSNQAILVRQPLLVNNNSHVSNSAPTGGAAVAEQLGQSAAEANTKQSGPSGMTSSSAINDKLAKQNQDLSSGVLAKLLRGEIDVTKVEKSLTEQTDMNYSALKQALAINSRTREADLSFLRQRQLLLGDNNRKEQNAKNFVELASIPVTQNRKLPIQGEAKHSPLTNNNRFPTLEALVSQKPSDKDMTSLEKDALQEYLGNEPVPELADITPSIAQMVNCQDEGTLAGEHAGKTSDGGGVAQTLLGLDLSQFSSQAQEILNASGHVPIFDPNCSLSSSGTATLSTTNQRAVEAGRHMSATDKLLNAAQMVIDLQQKQKQGQGQESSPGSLLLSAFGQGKLNHQKPPHQGGLQTTSGGEAVQQRFFLQNTQYVPNNATHSATTGSHTGLVSIQCQNSPAPSVLSLQSASSTPLSMLSPQSRNPPEQPCNSFMPIQETSLDSLPQGSPAQPTSVTQNQGGRATGGAAVPAQAQLGFLPYSSYKQPPEYEASVQNQRLLMQQQQQQHQHQMQQAHTMQQQQQFKAQDMQQQLQSFYQPGIQQQQQQHANASQASQQHINTSGINTLHQQFAPVSSIKPVKRGRGGGTGKGSKRVRHSSAQDSLRSRPGTKDVELASLLQAPLKKSASGPPPADLDPGFLALSGSVQGSDAGSNAAYSSNPPESPFSPEIQDIMAAADSDQMNFEQTMANAYRSHSVPALMLGGYHEDIQDIFLRTSATTTAHPGDGLEQRHVGGGDLLDNMTSSEINNLLQGKLHNQDTLGPHRGLNTSGTEDYGARKNLTEILENRLGGESPHSFITRGDHLISGATVRPPLRYAIQKHLSSMQRPHGQMAQQGQAYASNSVPTPPSSQNPTPDFSGELGHGSDVTHNFVNAAPGSSSAMDTPNSLEPGHSHESQGDLAESLFSSSADISQSLAREQQMDMVWS